VAFRSSPGDAGCSGFAKRGLSVVDADEKQIKEMVVASIGKCVACGTSYGVDGITVLGHQGDLWFLMVACTSCSSHALVAALIKEGKAQTLQGVDEAKSLLSKDPVTGDDVLDIHEFLQNFDGDFARLFDQPQPRG
jgi:hypothetical protein